MLRNYLTAHHHKPTAGHRHHRRSDHAMKPSFLAFLEDFDPGRFKRDAGYRLRIDQSLLGFSEAEATIFCRIYLKLLAH
jgi:hypothetical protein